MFAVIKTGGKQYRVAANDVLTIEKLKPSPATLLVMKFSLSAEGADARSELQRYGASVKAEVVEHNRAEGYRLQKRRRQNSKRSRGHRQHHLIVTSRTSWLPKLTGSRVKENSMAHKSWRFVAQRSRFRSSALA